MLENLYSVFQIYASLIFNISKSNITVLDNSDYRRVSPQANHPRFERCVTTGILRRFTQAG